MIARSVAEVATRFPALEAPDGTVQRRVGVVWLVGADLDAQVVALQLAEAGPQPGVENHTVCVSASLLTSTWGAREAIGATLTTDSRADGRLHVRAIHAWEDNGQPGASHLANPQASDSLTLFTWHVVPVHLHAATQDRCVNPCHVVLDPGSVYATFADFEAQCQRPLETMYHDHINGYHITNGHLYEGRNPALPILVDHTDANLYDPKALHQSSGVGRCSCCSRALGGPVSGECVVFTGTRFMCSNCDIPGIIGDRQIFPYAQLDNPYVDAPLIGARIRETYGERGLTVLTQDGKLVYVVKNERYPSKQRYFRYDLHLGAKIAHVVWLPLR